MSGVHVHVRVGGDAYALPVKHVLEVVVHGELAPLPGAGAHVLGLRNLRGQVTPVFDLAGLLGAAAGGPPRRVCVAEHGDGLGGLAVDEVTDVAELPDGGDEIESTLLGRSILVDGCLVGVVDVDRLFAELERRGGT